MIRAYDKIYLEKARIALARMLDYAVYDLEYELGDFWRLFLSSGIATRFENGDFTVLVGMSGVEISYTVLDAVGVEWTRIAPRYTVDRSAEYWTGWALAYYQWETGLRFSDITNIISISDIRDMYSPYHEMDIRQFVDRMNELMNGKISETKLKKIRTALGMSQSELATETDIPVRTIQQYEQRQKNLNKAQAEYLVKLAKVLYCDVLDLME